MLCPTVSQYFSFFIHADCMRWRHAQHKQMNLACPAQKRTRRAGLAILSKSASYKHPGNEIRILVMHQLYAYDHVRTL